MSYSEFPDVLRGTIISVHQPPHVSMICFTFMQEVNPIPSCCQICPLFWHISRLCPNIQSDAIVF
eukprot:4771027-Amphidinium_carterae.1